MNPIMAMSSHGPLLALSLLAISLTKFGKVVGDFTTVQQGQHKYSESLRRLQWALGDIVASKDEDTLACAVMLGLYEVRL